MFDPNFVKAFKSLQRGGHFFSKNAIFTGKGDTRNSALL